MLLSSAALECLGFLQAALGRRVSSTGNGATDADGIEDDPFVAEAAVAAQLGARVGRELAAALDLLLTPHLRARLRSLELLAPALGDHLSGDGER
jgi:hypothetical protein